ncbi:MAG TPA: PQQ-dependent sugar dehydrogenase [Vicinamibacterales bacterium]|nr:PQQ-dependent sugar dehydrogenase [Vicinamibacterales bacterium]
MHWPPRSRRLFSVVPSPFAAIQLTPVVSSGLSSPLFVGHAGDGTNRLFIVERGGVIKVLQPGASTPTVFLDIQTRVVAGGERGLLGLAFHPLYESNGRFFVFYTRAGDGTLVIAEYHVTADPNVASTMETVLLTIPHPTNTNHNGGMLAFGPDNYLYIGVGDGGSGNDPPNNAQNITVLLGKVLRIDVDPTEPGVPYVSPPTNPFFGPGGGEDEIFAFGLRNPWRFSFDPDTGLMWLADVGQGSREEVNTPIQNGGNYGWRVYEGSACTNNDPGLCNPLNYISPVFDYIHSGGRCSITGGYVYRGSQGALPDGIYVYGDYCSGEILSWNGMSQVVELDTTMNISSFGEDEAGEIYVVNLGGSVSRIVSTTPPCTYGISPGSQTFGAGGGTGTVDVTTAAGCPWSATSNASWIHVMSGSSGTGNGNVGYSIDANGSASPRTGTMTIAGRTFTVNQSGAAACTFSISPTSANYTRTGGNGSVTVTAPAGCGWTAVSNVPWMTINTGASGSGNGAVTYSVATYGGPPKKRNGTLTIAGQTFSVQQTK